jgi:L-fuculose-phosphate aldolase
VGHSPQTEIAWASRILAMHGHGDFTLGHISLREGDLIHMKRNGIGLEEVNPCDVLTLDLDGNRVAGEGRIHLEASLHTEVYRARPDVRSVIHTHPKFATAFGATDAKLELLNHDAVLFKDGLAYFDGTAELIINREQAASVARALGDKRVAIMRGHGLLVVGKSIPWAVYTALTLERVLEIQAIAKGFGALRPMTAEMAELVYPDKYRIEFAETYWQYLVRKLQRAGLAGDLPPVAVEA